MSSGQRLGSRAAERSLELLLLLAVSRDLTLLVVECGLLARNLFAERRDLPLGTGGSPLLVIDRAVARCHAETDAGRKEQHCGRDRTDDEPRPRVARGGLVVVGVVDRVKLVCKQLRRG